MNITIIVFQGKAQAPFLTERERGAGNGFFTKVMAFSYSVSLFSLSPDSYSDFHGFVLKPLPILEPPKKWAARALVNVFQTQSAAAQIPAAALL
ncbi:MAG: hypothetical protein LBV79_02680 [Candidatus Adiutrix sp.]|nr:hypothetical protein [Candidatus Adiutrix sp.]